MALVDRSAGLVPAAVPLGGLTEIRVHGVGGTGPDTLLGDPAPTRVAGDRVAGFYRTTDAGGRHREAYSWGGLTSRSRMRALWALLLPSMLANMAGWMARRWVTAGEQEADRPATLWIFRWFARLTALALTLSTAAMVTYLALDVLAYQWGRTEPVPAPRRPRRRTGGRATSRLVGTDRRRRGPPPTGPATGSCSARSPPSSWRPRSRCWPARRARRTRASSRRPRSARSPAHPTSPRPAGRPRPSLRCAAALDGGLRDADFWAGLEWHTFLSRLHLTACLGVIALMLGWSSASLGAGTDRRSVRAGRDRGRRRRDRCW